MSRPVYVWQPTTEEIARRAGIDASEVIRFDHNTSPLSPAWSAGLAARLAPQLNEYPGADYIDLRRAVAGYAGCDPDQVVPGAGADELIDLCARAFLPVGGVAVSAPPSYPMYGVATGQRETKLELVWREPPEFALPVRFIEAASEADLVWLCVPNNPTGGRDSNGEIEAVLGAAAGVVVIDAAYAEFTGDRWAEWVQRWPNLVVLGTLSKAFSLGGIRVGYAVTSPPLATELHRCRPPGSVSSLSAAIAAEALRRPEKADEMVALVTAGRAELSAGLAALGWETRPSVCNFVLGRVGPGAADLAESLMWEQGLVVRSFRPGSRLEDHLRVTVRTPGDHERLLAALGRRA